MISGIVLLVFLSAPPPQGPLPADRGNVVSADAFEEVVDEYKKAALEWRREQRAAKKAGVPFDAPHPIEAYYDRIEAFADTGNADALLWIGQNVQDTGRTPSEVTVVKREAFARLAKEHAAEPVMEELVKRIGKESEWLTDAEICSILERVYTVNEKKAIKGDAAYRLGQRFEERGTDEGRALAEAWYRRITEEFAGSKLAERAETRLGVLQIAVGKVAPDFEAEDVDGNAFKLSDYRGKVVVLDFWGFW